MNQFLQFRFLVFVFTFFGLICVSKSFAGVREFPFDLQEAAKEGIQDTTELKTAVDDVNQVLTALNSDSTFAQSFLTAVKSKDSLQLQNVLKQRATRTTVRIRSLDTSNSFNIVIGFETAKLKKFGLCISTDRICPGRKGVHVGALQ